MRRYLYASLVVFLISSLAKSAGSEDIFRARGFAQGQCYEQVASRKCYKNGEQCVLMLFPYSGRELRLSILGKTKLPNDTPTTTDFGLFQFQISKITGVPEVRLIKKIKISPNEFSALSNIEAKAKSVSCPK